MAAARNLGVEKATGKYLTFVDGDDYLQEDYIELMYSLAGKRNPGYGNMWSDLCGRRWKRAEQRLFQVCISVWKTKSGHSGFQQYVPIYTERELWEKI